MTQASRCRLCGSGPAADIGLGMLLCEEHAPSYTAWVCRVCGLHCLTHGSPPAPVCSGCLAEQRLAGLPPSILGQLDALLADDAVPAALKLMMSALQPGPGLGEALDLVGQRKKKLGLPNRKPSPPPDPEGLVAQLLALRPAPVAIEATWDGESVGFLVELEAILPAPSREHPRYTARHLHTFRDAVGDWRVFVGAVPPWPEAGEAAELGTELANRLNIPFHFASPDRPDLDAPRWWHKRR